MRKNIIITLLSVMLLFMTVYSFIKANDADRERALANEQRIIAEEASLHAREAADRANEQVELAMQEAERAITALKECQNN